jgi:hypothetical protein
LIEIDTATEEDVNSPVLSMVDEDGVIRVITPLSASLMDKLEAAGIDMSERRKSETDLWAANNWQEGNIVFAGGMPFAQETTFRTPKLSVPADFYTRAQYAQEYYETEPLVYSLVNRDVDQAITNEDFQLPEDQEIPKKALQRWRGKLNKSLGQHGGLSEYNRALALEIILTGMTFTLPNWGPILVDGKPVLVPENLVNFDAKNIIPDIDTTTGQRRYYYKLSRKQLEEIKSSRKNSPRKPAILQIIPDAKDRILTNLSFIQDKLGTVPSLLGYDATWLTSTGDGAWLDLPVDDAYIINFRARHNDRWPVPSLVPIFPAISMKRKLMMADWAVADGMVNMLVVWTFPPNTSPADGKGIVSKFMAGGRVQSFALPADVKVSIVTPPHEILNSSEKFWQPVSEIMAHFGYPLNAKSRGAGDLDSGPLDASTNRARLEVFREAIADHNTFFLKAIAERNDWDFDVYATLQSRDLNDDANFRTFASSAFDRGLLSIETFHDLLNTSTEREAARRKREQSNGLEDLFAIRPSFSQTVGTPGDGRPPESENKPKATGTGSDTERQQSRSSRARPPTSAKVTSN